MPDNAFAQTGGSSGGRPFSLQPFLPTRQGDTTPWKRDIETETEIEEPVRPDGLPDEFWDAEAGSIRLDELVGAYGAFASAERPPASPEDYALELDGSIGGPDAEAKPADARSRLHQRPGAARL